MKVSSSVSFAAPLLLCMLALSHAQEQPSIGVPVPPLGAGPWVFDTAEQHKVRVSVVTKGLSHPWAIAFLPDGGIAGHRAARSSPHRARWECLSRTPFPACHRLEPTAMAG